MTPINHRFLVAALLFLTGCNVFGSTPTGDSNNRQDATFDVGTDDVDRDLPPTILDTGRDATDDTRDDADLPTIVPTLEPVPQVPALLPGLFTTLLVVNDLDAPPGARGLSSYLRNGLGGEPTFHRDEDPDISGAFDIVLIAEAVMANVVLGTYLNTPKPVMVMEPIAYDNMEFVTSADAINDPIGPPEALLSAGHPIADGFVDGNVTFVTSATSEIGFARNLVGGTPILTIGANSLMFAFDTGDTSGTGFVMPEKRVGLGLFDSTISSWTLVAWTLFSSAILWMADITLSSPDLEAPTIGFLTDLDQPVSPSDAIMLARMVRHELNVVAVDVDGALDLSNVDAVIVSDTVQETIRSAALIDFTGGILTTNQDHGALYGWFDPEDLTSSMLDSLVPNERNYLALDTVGEFLIAEQLVSAVSVATSKLSRHAFVAATGNTLDDAVIVAFNDNVPLTDGQISSGRRVFIGLDWADVSVDAIPMFDRALAWAIGN